jgi:uncharacterized protein (UPF0212 family)
MAWLSKFCPGCGERVKFVWTAGNVLRFVAGTVAELVFVDVFKVWFRCPHCDTRFKAE